MPNYAETTISLRIPALKAPVGDGTANFCFPLLRFCKFPFRFSCCCCCRRVLLSATSEIWPSADWRSAACCGGASTASRAASSAGGASAARPVPARRPPSRFSPWNRAPSASRAAPANLPSSLRRLRISFRRVKKKREKKRKETIEFSFNARLNIDLTKAVLNAES